MVDGVCGAHERGQQHESPQLLRCGDCFGEDAVLRPYTPKGHLHRRSVYAATRTVLALLSSDDITQLRKEREAIDHHLRPLMRSGPGATRTASDTVPSEGATSTRAEESAQEVTLERLDFRLQKMEAMLQQLVSERQAEEPAAPQDRAGSLTATVEEGALALVGGEGEPPQRNP